jgi:hypothetical protein
VISHPSQAIAACAVTLLVFSGLLPHVAAEEDSLNRLKISADGRLFFNREPIDLTELTGRLLQLKTDGRALVPYREAGRAKPSADVEAILEVLNATKVRLILPEEAASEWGELEMVEVEVAPHRFRLALAAHEPYFIGFTPKGASRPLVTHGPPLPEREKWLRATDVLISADRVMETKTRDPDGAFREESLADRSVHVAVHYKGRPRWSSWYPAGQLPPNIKSFVEDCKALAVEIMPQEDAKLLRAYVLW